MLTIGCKIPEFELDAYHEDSFKKVKLHEDYKGKWLAVVFYPADFTFVCPTELEELAVNYDDFKAENCEIVSVSTDTHFVHKAWHDASPAIKKIKYPMLADPTGNVSKEFGTYICGVGLAYRGTYVFNPDGELVFFEINANSIGRSAKELLRKIRAAKYVAEHGGEVCPASWEPGKETLKPGINLVGKI